MRFEEPDPKNRWDSPCFTLAPEDDLVAMFGEAILEAIIYKKGTKPNKATHKVSSYPRTLNALGGHHPQIPHAINRVLSRKQITYTI